ncbi:hypothetical protein AHF37_02069 [Paragonimus kellicotti]|nr:hypothetical protein AHF37_02069 [Paragonimus kellicotti]
MSQRPFGFSNRHALRDNYSYERAAPRASGPNEKRYHHPVIPISSAAVPHYAQASQLYPMRTSSERDSLYRYKPGSGALGTTARSASPLSSGQPVTIPVLHLGQTRGSVASPTGTTSYIGGSGGSGTESPHTSGAADTAEINYRTPSYRTSSVLPSSGRSVGGRAQVTNDQEAEVDALTNLLMQSMETKSSSSCTSGLGSSDGPTSSPAGSLRRSSGPSTPISFNSQIGRLQQHLGMSTGAVGTGLNGGRGSPLTTGASVNNSTSIAGSSSTNSPTGSTSSVHNVSDVSGAGSTIVTSSITQNSCFRCRRPLIPPEGTTLNPNLSAINNGNNVVTLTGALSVRLHVACFTCYRCAAPLRPDAYYHIPRRLLCPACVRDGAVEMCSNCRRPIGEHVVHALGLPYHPNCFVCVVCAGRLDSRPFTIDVHGRLHCLDDFHRRYAPRCAHCGRPIAPEPGSQEARRVVSGDSNYHLECFGIHTISQPSTSNQKLSAGVAS